MAVVAVVRQSMRRYTKFLMVGAFNAAVDLLVFNALLYLYPTQSDFWVTTYNTIAVACAIVNSYIWNRFWTFSDVSKGTAWERGKYVAQALLNVLLNDLIVAWASRYLTMDRALSTVVSGNLAKAIGMVVSSSITYTILRLFVFPKSR